ncbi:MAG: hypothetical protein ABSC65_21525 [Acidobacteriaceae bacterium]|jgi:hypothetical protein
MSRTESRLVGFVSHLLEPNEREVVLGDLEEGGENARQSLVAILGLVIRREAALWRNWRPWLAAFGLALPFSFLLMGFSLSVSRAYQQYAGVHVGPGFALLLCNVLLLAGWAWTGGFVVGAISRRTLWVSAALSFAPCLFCLERFRVESLSRLCLLLFLPAALWGARRGLQLVYIKRSSAIALAVGVTALTIPLWSSSGLWLPNWALSWPAWYLVATARKA